MKILTILGARPQFIKAGAVSRIFKQNNINEIILHTGQHFDDKMSKVFFEELEIPEPDINLNINSLSHGAMTGRMIEGIENVIVDTKPDWVLVYGDTNSTVAGALAAKKMHIKIAHVEAGLRSFNTKMPEEINRILTDRISDILFCPTETAVKNLLHEGYENIDCRVENVGDVMFDAVCYYRQKAKKIEDDLPGKFALLTLHRAENTGNKQRMENIFKALDKISADIPVIFPVHPGTKKMIEQYNIKTCVRLIEPVSYFEMLFLLENCQFVMTDSGGLQKEAYFFKKPCITLRDETEWVELVDKGYNFLAGADTSKILQLFENIKNFKATFPENIYGNGNASEKILNSLLNY